MYSDEIVVCICNADVAEELALPADVAVITDLVESGEAYLISREKFIEYFKTHGERVVRKKS